MVYLRRKEKMSTASESALEQAIRELLVADPSEVPEPTRSGVIAVCHVKLPDGNTVRCEVTGRCYAPKTEAAEGEA